jgi:1-acyl-sn-glycerol-3-phosphate acyltransferase
MTTMHTTSVDGFSPADKEAFAGYSPAASARVYESVYALAARLGVDTAGLENLPKGRALLVANHTFGFDVLFVMAAIWRHTGRRVWTLGEHAWWRLPYVRRIAAALGVVDGTPQNADRLLANEELVLVLPGGLREAVKPRELRYQLLWGRRYGFVRAAIRNRTPLVPVACVGADDLFDFVGNPFTRGARWLGSRAFPIPLPACILPIPRRVRLNFVIGEPVMPDAQPDEAEDLKVLRRVRREVEGALHELLENELARRAGISL